MLDKNLAHRFRIDHKAQNLILDRLMKQNCHQVHKEQQKCNNQIKYSSWVITDFKIITSLSIIKPET